MKNIFAKIKNPKVLRVIVAVISIALVAGSYFLYAFFQGRLFIDNSLVQAPVVTITAPNAGTLTEMDAYEGEKVNKGDSLAIVAGQAIYAPTDGLIVMADNQIGSSVSLQTPLVQLINAQDMRIAGTIDENKGLSDIKVGQVVSFTVDALPGKVFWGYIDEISPSAKSTQNAFSISSERPTQQFVVYAKFNAVSSPAVKNGMSAKMTVFTNSQ